MTKNNRVIDTVLALLGPVLRLLAMVLEPKFPNAARHLRSIGTATDIASGAVALA